MDGVVGIFTADDLPPVAPPANPALASDAMSPYVGQPILAVAATSGNCRVNNRSHKN